MRAWCFCALFFLSGSLCAQSLQAQLTIIDNNTNVAVVYTNKCFAEAQPTKQLSTNCFTAQQLKHEIDKTLGFVFDEVVHETTLSDAELHDFLQQIKRIKRKLLRIQRMLDAVKKITGKSHWHVDRVIPTAHE